MNARPTFELNAPNAITLGRLALVPVFAVFLLWRAGWTPLAALTLFLAAALSDVVDGYLARHGSQVTTFGQFADPLADKLLMSTAWLAFIERGELGAWVVIVLIGREFLVTGLRILAVAQGQVLSAGPLGKLKTLTHILLVMVILGGQAWGPAPGISGAKEALVWLSLLTSVGSAGHYFYRSRTLFLPA